MDWTRHGLFQFLYQDDPGRYKPTFSVILPTWYKKVGTKTEIIIVTINVKVNSQDDTLSALAGLERVIHIQKKLRT
jgi:hypothetical protein